MSTPIEIVQNYHRAREMAACYVPQDGLDEQLTTALAAVLEMAEIGRLAVEYHLTIRRLESSPYACQKAGKEYDRAMRAYIAKEETP